MGLVFIRSTMIGQLSHWLTCMRSAFHVAEPDRMHIFRMQWQARVLWQVPQVLPSNCRIDQRMMICVPIASLGSLCPMGQSL